MIGVLVMAYGGPNSLEDIPGYLADIRSGRPTPRAVVEEITHNYRAIGGRSPLLDLTRQQAQAIASHFEPDRYKFYIGMRHWAPWIEDAVRDMLEDGIRRAISIVMAPHYSQMSVARYQARLAAALEMFHGEIEFAHIESYHDAAGYLQALANRVQEGLDCWPPGQQDQVHVIFSAHSLPTRIVGDGDLYPTQLLETARWVAERAGLPPQRWSWSYQSAGRSQEAWLGPQLDEHLAALAKQGVKDVVSVPVGFVCDHVEILYDVDVQAQRTARRLGMRLERPPALNTDPLFIASLAQVIREKVEALGW